MRIVITGHKGQLGRALQEALGGEDLLGLDLPECDLREAGQVRAALVAFRPDVVIHTAAMTNVDVCERDADAAFRANVLATQNVALACERTGAALVHISTNDVFDGTLDRPYYEWDPPSPRSVYARTKAAAELVVRSLLRRFYIARTAWLYAPGGDNFVTKILAAADRPGGLRVVTDEISSPTYGPHLAQAIARLIQTEQFGFYHLVNSGCCSRYDWAREILRLAGRSEVPIEPITTAEWHRPAPPPLYTPLVNLAAAALGITLPPWQAGLQAYFEQMRARDRV
jgi:dTDP-4-dehydrorhamnose reductase